MSLAEVTYPYLNIFTVTSKTHFEKGPIGWKNLFRILIIFYFPVHDIKLFESYQGKYSFSIK